MGVRERAPGGRPGQGITVGVFHVEQAGWYFVAAGGGFLLGMVATHLVLLAAIGEERSRRVWRETVLGRAWVERLDLHGDIWQTVAVVDRLLRWTKESPEHPIARRLRAQVAILERKAKDDDSPLF